MSVSIEKSGVLATVQDLGRTGFRRFGINLNGAMDAAAARLINVLLGNHESEAIVETHFPAPIFRFRKPAMIAVGGADFAARIDETPIENWRLYAVEANQILTFTGKIKGNRAYLAVKGGFAAECWLGSRSANLAAKIGGNLRKGDRLDFNSTDAPLARKFQYKISNSIIPFYSSMPTVRVTAGAEFEHLTALSETDFLKNNFVISRNSNRMGFRLTGSPLYTLGKINLISSAVSFGTIQLTPDGQMIILMADAQTSGGYPRIAHVASIDLPVLAQLGAGDAVNFQLISVEEAENLSLQFEKDLNLLKIGVDFKK